MRFYVKYIVKSYTYLNGFTVCLRIITRARVHYYVSVKIRLLPKTFIKKMTNFPSGFFYESEN